jgi:hypothetical protein
MRKLIWLAVPLALVGVGCGGDDASMCGDAGCVTDAGALSPDGPMQWGLTSGTNNFVVTGIATGFSDGCMLGVDKFVNMTVSLTYTSTATAGTVSVGEQTGSPVMAALGMGPISGNNATLTRENDAGDATCKYHQKDVSVFTLIGHDQFTLSVTEDESNFEAQCANVDPGIPPGGKCTSTWTWTAKKQ